MNMAVNIHHVYLGLGANLGDRQQTLCAARDRLSTVMDVVRCSSLYETQPWGVTDQPPFLNAVCYGRTALAPDDLLAALKVLEQQLGRVASTRWGPRAIDLDILFFDDLVLTSPNLTIPHPLLHQRPFVLIPLNELAPQLRHPVLGQSISALTQACDTKHVQKTLSEW